MTVERPPTGMAADPRGEVNPGRYKCPAACPLGTVGAREWRLNPHGEGPKGELWCPGSNYLLPPQARSAA